MDTPPVWSENIVRNFERVIEWTDAVALFCDISSTDYELYQQRYACRIEKEELQSSIIALSANYGRLLDWIVQGQTCLNTNPRLPEKCLVTVQELSSYASHWQKHVCVERQIMDELKKQVLSINNNLKAQLAIFHEEESEAYSSYSDYSESTSSDDEDEDYKEKEEVEEEDEHSGKKASKHSSQKSQKKNRRRK